MERATQKQEFSSQIETTESVSENVIAALAAISDLEQFSPTKWQSTFDTPTLYDVVDPDALDALFRGRMRGGRANDHVAFAYGDYKIRVRRDGEVTVSLAANVSAEKADD